MDRSWISAPKLSETYKRGVEEFLNFASQNPLEDGKMDCPCRRCRNLKSLKRGTIRKHLLKHSFDSDYTRWVCHGEIDLTSRSSESTEKNDGDVDRGNDSKSTGPGDSAGPPKHAKEEVKDIDVQDQGADQSAPKLSESYKRGVEEFLNFASQNPLEDGEMNCPCRRCRNLKSLKRGTVRKHLLKHGFDSDYTQWVCHGEIDLTSRSSESTEKNDGDVDRGNDSKSTEGPGDSAGLPKHAKEEIKDIDVKDQGPDQKKIFVLQEEQDFGTKGQKFALVSEQLCQRPDDRKMLLFAFYLYKLRRKFGWDRESFDELITYMINVFPMFNRLPICFNVVWNAFGYDNLNLSNTEHGNCSSSELANKVLTEMSLKCYACNHYLKSDARTSTSSRRRNKRKPPSKK